MGCNNCHLPVKRSMPGNGTRMAGGERESELRTETGRQLESFRDNDVHSPIPVSEEDGQCPTGTAEGQSEAMASRQTCQKTLNQ